jgi:HEAT repeat protein
MRKHGVAFALTALVLAISSGTGAVAQDAKTSTKELTIEELFLKSVKFQVLKEKAFSGDRTIKLNALSDLEKMIKDNTIGDNKAQVQFILEYLSLEGSMRTVREDKRLVNYFPDVRMMACRLLGQMGGREAQRALINVLLGDKEPTVKSEAVYAIGVIGLNENNEAVDAIAFAFDKEDPRAPDSNFAFAVCLALEKLGGKGVIETSTAFRTLVKVLQGNYNPETRAKAQSVLDGMDSQSKK